MGCFRVLFWVLFGIIFDCYLCCFVLFAVGAFSGFRCVMVSVFGFAGV